jgi:phage terminase large subunit-like protein
MTLREELIQYCNDVISNTIISCKKHKWACMRFLRDLERENTDDFPYVFVEEKANRFFTWAELFKHSKGKLAGQKIVMHIFWKFVFGNVYGWVHRETGYRRFNKLYAQVARKNAKSQMLSAVASYEAMAFDERGIELSEVYCAATKREQAKIVYDEVVTMLGKCEELKNKYKIAYGRITHKRTGSFIRPLSKDDYKTGDGYNPQCGIIDEYHAHDTSEMYDVIETGMGARMQPLLAVITTAGFDLDGPCFRVEYDLVSQIINPEILLPIENYMVIICEVDTDKPEVEGVDIVDQIEEEIKNDFLVITKANPIICSYPEGIEYLKQKYSEAAAAAEKMVNFLTKHANVWVHRKPLAYMDMSKWNFCIKKSPELSGESCIIGVDMSAKIDMTSLGFEFKIDDKYIIFSHSFIPEDTLQQKIRTDKMPYDLWARQGYITIVPGAVIDYRIMLDYAFEITNERNWRRHQWALDPWGTTQVSNILIDEGEECVEIMQGIKTLSEPTKDFRDQVYLGNVIHDGNPVLKQAVNNAVTRYDHNKNFMLDKDKSVKRIDPIAAVINAHRLAMVAELIGPAYDKRGMRQL